MGEWEMKIMHDSDCSTNNRGVPELLGPCDCRLKPSLVAHNLEAYAKQPGLPLGDYAREMLREAAHVVLTAGTEDQMSRNGFADCEREYNRKEEAIEMAKEERMETDLEFVRRMRRLVEDTDIRLKDSDRLLRLAETAALIVEHDMDLISPFKGCAKWTVYALMGYAMEDARVEDESLHTAVRAVAAKIGEVK